MIYKLLKLLLNKDQVVTSVSPGQQVVTTVTLEKQAVTTVTL